MTRAKLEERIAVLEAEVRVLREWLASLQSAAILATPPQVQQPVTLPWVPNTWCADATIGDPHVGSDIRVMSGCVR